MISKGLVKHEDKILLENITFYITEANSSGPALNTWSGYFHIPSGKYEEADIIAELDEPLTLVLQDGKSGEFLAEVTTMGARMTANFLGTGELKKGAQDT